MGAAVILRRLVPGLLGMALASAAGGSAGIPQCLDSELSGDRVVKLGMSTALSGPNQYLGLSMMRGVLRRLSEANCSPAWAGIHPKVSLVVLDDAYQPDAAEINTRTLIEQEEVIALVGNVGTPTAQRSWPLADEAGVVFYGAYTGARSLRATPPAAYVFNYRASYEQEMELIVGHVAKSGIPFKRIGFFLQDDDFGAAGFDAARAALERRGFRYTAELATTRYPRNSLSVQRALESFIRADRQPEAIIIVGAYRPSAEFIEFAYGLLPNTRFYNLSFSGASELARLLPMIDSRVYMTQVVPRAEALENEVEREGYLAAGLLLEAIARVSGASSGGAAIGGDALRRALEAIERDRHRESGSEAPPDHQFTDQVWLAELELGGRWQTVR